MVHLAALFLIMPVTKLFIASSSTNTNPKSIFPSVLVFGDSTVDTGNNNYITTYLKADHEPYGLNFPGGLPTGRFSNGKLVPDIMASVVGLKDSVPPFLDPTLSDEDILTGVCFASAGSGYDDLTTTLTAVIPVSRQPDYFKKYIKRLQGIVGEKEASRLLSEAIVIISAGTNDFIFNFYDIPDRRLQYNVHTYQDFLHSKLQDLVKTLYDLGCRKIVVAGIPPMGCLPMQTTLKFKKPGHCIKEENEDAQSYNNKLQKLLPQMEAKLPGSLMLYADIYNPLIDILNNPQKYGFAETKKGCCGSGLVEVGPFCIKFDPVCSKPSDHVFWDSIHPTESTYKVLSESFKALIPKLSGSNSTY